MQTIPKSIPPFPGFPDGLPESFARGWTLRDVGVLDPSTGEDSVRDLFSDGRILLDAPRPGVPEFRCSGFFAMPAAIDLHVHFRQPGAEDAETVASGLAAAARGGFGQVVAMPNTTPPLDSPDALRNQTALAAAAAERRVRFSAAGCCTVGRAGLAKAGLGALAGAGAVAFSDDGAMVADDGVMRSVMLEAAKLGLPVMDHCVFPAAAGGGVVRDCRLARDLGLAPFPDEAEVAAVARDIALARETGAWVHLQHLSAAGSVLEVAGARRSGLEAISCEATPHHLLFSAEDIPGDDASFKMNPPLGSVDGRAALRAAVLDGTVDCFATDHAPHPAVAKARGFAAAPFGCTGLETALAATWRAMVVESGMRPVDWAARWTSGPARVLGLERPGLAPGSEARVAVLRKRPWTPCEGDLASRSRNCPFLGRRFPIAVAALLA